MMHYRGDAAQALIGNKSIQTKSAENGQFRIEAFLIWGVAEHQILIRFVAPYLL